MQAVTYQISEQAEPIGPLRPANDRRCELIVGSEWESPAKKRMDHIGLDPITYGTLI